MINPISGGEMNPGANLGIPAMTEAKGEEFLTRLKGAIGKETEQTQGSTKALTSEEKADREKEKEKLRAACRDFEAIMIQQMLKSMRATVPRSELTDDGLGMDVYQDMLDEQYSLEASKSGQFGLSEMLMQQLQQPEGEQKA